MTGISTLLFTIGLVVGSQARLCDRDGRLDCGKSFASGRLDRDFHRPESRRSRRRWRSRR